jgi:hypothetical protein
MKLGLWFLVLAMTASVEAQAKTGVIVVSSETNPSAPEELRRVDGGLTYAIAVSDFHPVGSLPRRKPLPDPAVVAAAVAGVLPVGRLVALTDQPDVLLACHHGEVSPRGAQPPVATKTGRQPTRSISSVLTLGRGFVPLLTRSERAELSIHEYEDLFFLVVTAYDGHALREGREEVLWQTRMSVDSLRSDPQGVWSAMARAGATHFGRDLPRPSFERGAMGGSSETHLAAPARLPEVLSARANEIRLALF